MAHLPRKFFLPLLLLLLLLAVGFYPSPCTATCNIHDQKALLAVKSSFGNPSKLSSWVPTTSCCVDWVGVLCHSTTNRVTALSIAADPNITAKIPPPVADLTYLQSLTLSEIPNLSGPVIPILARLRHLTHIDLSSNSLSGPVPSFLASMSNLDFVDLSHNRLTGSVPPQLSSLPKLTSLNLAGNRLTGSIPESFGKFASLSRLFLSENHLAGPVPRSLGSLEFAVLDLSSNRFSGDASFLLRPSNETWAIYLSGNNFEFDLSAVEFSEKLLLLDISRNRIFGRIPRQLAAVPELQSLNVSYNRLCGQIPTGGRMSRFGATSYLHNKCLCGTPLPACN